MRVLAVILLCVAAAAEAKIYERCELAYEMRGYVVFQARLADWVCLVEHESSRNTSAVGGPNSNGSYDWGLFQINDRYWCGNNVVSGDCSMKCQSLLVDDGVLAAKTCVEKIYNRHGFSAWHAWVRSCENQPLPDLGAECGIH